MKRFKDIRKENSTPTANAKKRKINLDNHNNNDNDNDKIWLNDKWVQRPNYPTSHGILLYKQDTVDSPIQYLLGLIPQRSAWTVFKGLPEPNERPQETAVREFREETTLDCGWTQHHHDDDDNDDDNDNGTTHSTNNNNMNQPIAELYGVTSTKKLLHIYLLQAPNHLNIHAFDKTKVVKIDQGRFKGLPEIVQLQFLTKQQAIQGVVVNNNNKKQKAVKIYKSQIPILERAETILKTQTTNNNK